MRWVAHPGLWRVLVQLAVASCGDGTPAVVKAHGHPYLCDGLDVKELLSWTTQLVNNFKDMKRSLGT